MSQHQIETVWMGKMQFNASVNGHTIVMDAPPKVGGEDAGSIPKPFVLVALSGCTGMDIVALLRKSNLKADQFSMTTTGELSRHSPIEYVSMHIVYSFKANDGMKDSILTAVNDSQEKYCGVSHMLKKALPVTWDVILNDRQIFSNKPVLEKQPGLQVSEL